MVVQRVQRVQRVEACSAARSKLSHASSPNPCCLHRWNAATSSAQNLSAIFTRPSTICIMLALAHVLNAAWWRVQSWLPAPCCAWQAWSPSDSLRQWR